jgi:hypothetical protein
MMVILICSNGHAIANGRDTEVIGVIAGQLLVADGVAIVGAGDILTQANSGRVGLVERTGRGFVHIAMGSEPSLILEEVDDLAGDVAVEAA